MGPVIASSTNGCQTNFERYINKADKTSFAFQNISYSKVFKFLINWSLRQLVSIKYGILKVGAPVITNSITKIFNCSIESGKFPLDWKIARVTPLHKKGPRNLLDNYRPISILSTIVKFLRKYCKNNFTIIDQKIICCLNINLVSGTSILLCQLY